MNPEVADDGEESSRGEHDGAVWILCVEDLRESEVRSDSIHFLCSSSLKKEKGFVFCGGGDRSRECGDLYCRL